MWMERRGVEACPMEVTTLLHGVTIWCACEFGMDGTVLMECTSHSTRACECTRLWGYVMGFTFFRHFHFSVRWLCGRLCGCRGCCESGGRRGQVVREFCIHPLMRWVGRWNTWPGMNVKCYTHVPVGAIVEGLLTICCVTTVTGDGSVWYVRANLEFYCSHHICLECEPAFRGEHHGYFDCTLHQVFFPRYSCEKKVENIEGVDLCDKCSAGICGVRVQLGGCGLWSELQLCWWVEGNRR